MDVNVYRDEIKSAAFEAMDMREKALERGDAMSAAIYSLVTDRILKIMERIQVLEGGRK